MEKSGDTHFSPPGRLAGALGAGIRRQEVKPRFAIHPARPNAGGMDVPGSRVLVFVEHIPIETNDSRKLGVVARLKRRYTNGLPQRPLDFYHLLIDFRGGCCARMVPTDANAPVAEVVVAYALNWVEMLDRHRQFD